MKKSIKLLSIVLVITGIAVYTASCVKQDFDSPPLGTIPVGEVINIAEIREIYSDSGIYQFRDDFSVYANVIMDESSGNIFRSAYIQDTSGAINLHLKEPGGLRIGDKIRVYLKNCMLSEYNGLLQIDNVHNDSNIIIMANGQYLSPEVVTIDEIKESGAYESQLVKLEGVQFIENDLGKNYAEPDESANRTLEDCDENQILVRTSNYANFANDQLPEGNGSLVAVVGIYNGTWQLYIRTKSEVDLTGERCGGGPGPGPQPVESINETFDDVTAFEDIDLPGWYNIIGAGNRRWQGKEFSGNKYAQATGYNSGLSEMITWLITPPVNNANGDKKLSFESAKAYWEHQSNDGFSVLISTDFDGNDVTTATWTPLDATLPSQGDDDYEWIPSGEIDLSAHAGTCYIAFKYQGSDDESTTYQVDNVVVNGGGGGPGVTSIDEDFESQENDVDIYISGWLNSATEGGRVWRGKEFTGNIYAQATSYNSNEDNICWLVTPAINLDEMSSPKLEFESAKAFWEHDGLRVYISTDFNGSNIGNATWIELDALIAGQNDPDHEWIPSGVIDLSEFTGTGYVGFKYSGSDIEGETTSYRIDNVKLYD